MWCVAVLWSFLSCVWFLVVEGGCVSCGIWLGWREYVFIFWYSWWDCGTADFFRCQLVRRSVPMFSDLRGIVECGGSRVGVVRVPIWCCISVAGAYWACQVVWLCVARSTAYVRACVLRTPHARLLHNRNWSWAPNRWTSVIQVWWDRSGSVLVGRWHSV